MVRFNSSKYAIGCLLAFTALSGCGDDDPQACGDMAFIDEVSGACASYSDCDPGEYVNAPGTATSDQACASCAAGTFSATGNASSCEPYTVCDAGEYVSSQPSETRDRGCNPCAAGTFNVVENASTCSAHVASCEPGEYVTDMATSVSDRACASCDEGTFSTTPNAAACEPQTDCDPGTYLGVSDPSSPDRTCEACAEMTYSDYTNANACAAWKLCDEGELDGGEAPSATADLVCIGWGWARNVDAESVATLVEDMAVMPDGSSYVVGSQFIASDHDVLVVKLDANGDEVWRETFGTGELDEARGVDVDDAGNIFVVGYTYGALEGEASAGAYDAFVAKYSADHDLLWVDQFGTEGYDRAFDVTIEAGKVFVAGDTEGDLSGVSKGRVDSFVRVYDADSGNLLSDANVLNTFQFGTTSDDVPRAIAVGPVGEATEGAIYIAGYTFGAFADETSRGISDGFLVKMNAVDGTLTWARQFGGTSNDYTEGVALGDDGAVYVAGYGDGVSITGADGQEIAVPSLGARDALLFRYSDEGELDWARSWGTSNNDFGRDVSMGPGGEIYVVAETRFAAIPDLSTGRGTGVTVREYNADGEIVWTTQFGTTSDDYPRAIGVLDNDAHADHGAIYVGGYTDGTFPDETSYNGDSGFVVKIPAP